MIIAVVRGRATSTVKHPSLTGCKLLVVEMLGNEMQPTGDPVLVLDHHGAGLGQRVIISSDGLGLRNLLGNNQSPARWWTLGIVDDHGVRIPSAS